MANRPHARGGAIGVAIPYGIYDLLANRGSVFVGVSHDTAAFASHSIAGWWKRDGADRYRRGRQLLILADTGGSNGCRTGAWKTELQTQLCNSFGLTRHLRQHGQAVKTKHTTCWGKLSERDTQFVPFAEFIADRVR